VRRKCTEWHIQNVLTPSTMVYWIRKISGKLSEHCKYIMGKLQNRENFECSYSVLRVCPEFSESSEPWSKASVHSECAIWYTFGAPVHFILNFPNSEHCESRDQENCKVHFE
jgi:hypothetical protein